MRPSIRSALERSAELTRSNQFVEAVAIAEAAFNRATDDELPEIRQWLNDHTNDFIGKV
ncbi:MULTISPECIES: hypothetical protein [Streptomyces]|uniref:Uncharacterized protein n=1 Tax=Streptomyces zaomyceticus TaxID=68286 RepID=A0ABZ1L6T7_9ACTN|nr:hypothetical protein OG237_28860 [Streptomyces zaomyceticus]